MSHAAALLQLLGTSDELRTASVTYVHGRKCREIDDITSNSACAAGWGGDSHSTHGLSTPEAVPPDRVVVLTQTWRNPNLL
eukprot:362744-Chlamydomonas_euryale.AAC.1